MKLKDLVLNVDKSDMNSSYVDISHLAYQFDISTYDYFDEQDLLKSYWLWKRYDTDTYVGIEAYFLNDEFVGINTTTGRKNGGGELEFVSKEAANKVKDFILTLIQDNEEDTISIIDMEEEMGLGLPISYSSELLTSTLYHPLSNQLVDVTQKWPHHEDYKRWGLVNVRFQDGNEGVLSLYEDLLVPYCISTVGESL